MELPTNLKYQFKYTLIADYMFRLFKDNSCGHDFWHVYRTCETAHALAVTEHLDWRAMGRIEILALIHDVFDEKIVYRIPVDSVYRDLERKMYPYMKSLNTSFEELKASATSLRWSNDGSLASIEEKIVMDADRLDAIGAIGIIRAAAYGGAKKMHMYDAKSPEIDYSSGTPTTNLSGWLANASRFSRT
jgi:uncharacterized protein